MINMFRYLRLKESISIHLPDDNWAFHEDDVIVIEKVGLKLFEMNVSGTITKSVNDCWRLNQIRYNKLVKFEPTCEYEIEILTPNLIDAKFKGRNTLWIPIASSDQYTHIFEDVTTQYIREEKIKNLIDK